MARRREFTRDTSAEIMLRVKRDTGFQCEICHLVVTKGEIHHTKQDAMETDKRRKLTAKDGVFVCVPCHKAESAAQAPVMAAVKRQEAAHLRIATPTRNPIPAPAPRAPAPKASKMTSTKPAVVDRGSLFARYCQKDSPQ